MNAAQIIHPRDAELYRVLDVAGRLHRRVRLSRNIDRELAAELTLAAEHVREYARRWWRLELLLEAKGAEERAALEKTFRAADHHPHSRAGGRKVRRG